MGLIRSSARGEAEQRAATAAHRTHSASAADGWEYGQALWRQHRSTRSRWPDAAIRCTGASGEKSRDASPLAVAALGSAVVVQRGGALHAGCAGSEHRRGAQTPGERTRRTPRGSTGSRNRIARRCTPASRSGDNGRAGRLPAPRAAPRPPPRRHWTAPRRRGIKGWQSCLRRRCAPRARGLTPIKTPGPSSMCVSYPQHSRSRQNRTQGAGAHTPSHPITVVDLCPA